MPRHTRRRRWRARQTLVYVRRSVSSAILTTSMDALRWFGRRRGGFGCAWVSALEVAAQPRASAMFVGGHPDLPGRLLLRARPQVAGNPTRDDRGADREARDPAPPVPVLDRLVPVRAVVLE